MHIRAVIMDYDGVILDSFREGLRRIKILCAIHDIPFARKERSALIEHWGLPGVELLMAGLSIENRKFVEKIYREWERLDEHTPIPLVPGAREVLFWLRKNDIKSCLLTSRLKESVTGILDGMDLLREFVVVATRDDHYYSKPDPRAFRFTLETLREQHRIQKEECVFVGDTIADIKGGHNAEIETLVVQTGPYLLKQVNQCTIPLTHIIQSTDDLPFWTEEHHEGTLKHLYE